MLPIPLINRLINSILSIFFKLLYHQFAFTYDWVASIVSVGAWRYWVTSILPELNGHRILEIGFGPGHLQAGLAQKGMNAFGLDESKQMSKIARRQLIRMGYGMKLILGLAQHLPFVAGSFDQVVMTFPAEFILSQSTFSEIWRVLDDAGSVIILPAAWITGRKPLERAAAWINHASMEAPEWDEKYIEPLISFGFNVSWEMINFQSSKLLMIHMIKKL